MDKERRERYRSESKLLNAWYSLSWLSVVPEHSRAQAESRTATARRNPIVVLRLHPAAGCSVRAEPCMPRSRPRGAVLGRPAQRTLPLSKKLVGGAAEQQPPAPQPNSMMRLMMRCAVSAPNGANRQDGPGKMVAST